MRHRRWSVVALAAAALAVAGCGSSSPSSVPTTVATTAPPATAPAPTAPAATAPPASSAPATTAAPAPTTTAPATPQQCTTGRLTARVSNPDGTAGAVDYVLELLNTGSASCTVEGYPGLSFVAGTDGHQVGAAAARLVGPTPVVLVAPGHGADARVSVTDPNNFTSVCKVTSVLGFRIYPPDNTAALFVPHTDETCADQSVRTLGVGPLHAP